MKKFKESVIKTLLPQIILSRAAEQEIYGYQMIVHIRKRFGVYLGPSTVYPELNDLEKKGFIKSRWEIPNGRPRKLYTLTNKGRVLLGQTTTTLALVNKMMVVQTA